MKHCRLIIIFCLFMLATVLGRAQIAGSQHDFRWMSSEVPDNELCKPCHAPHVTNTEILPPLWNHALSPAPYVPYSSVTLDATAGQPDGNSKLCLSCHDRWVAIGSYGGRTGSARVPMSYSVGPNLQKDHPISIVYSSALVAADGGLKDPSEPSGLGRTIAEDLLFEGKVQCASCHEIHGPRGEIGSGFRPYLRKTTQGSELCFTCHNK